ncbi:hypothetical protein THAOC_14407 [Thalassiosira oceanica]|uniref:RING-type domain-containing protein n=1 Tax=Thalassiosira oceanica TaxID=159749 RepID=K0SFC8_THAOC|nr:hypothetical protein THAOC_14407 [Thalassiosira oceanica]|eukprot:EJK64818.1 hypothetical protein THAOC_14407 [Thalassiosira oceanica]
MTDTLHDDTAVRTDQSCGICLEDSKDPLTLPCGHSFCDGCLNEWRSRYGVREEMRRKCPICRAEIPPSKEMVTTLLGFRARKQKLEDDNETSTDHYHEVCRLLQGFEENVGADWDGVTVLPDNNDKPAVVMPDYIFKAIGRGDAKPVLKWINANRTEDRVNAVSSADTTTMTMPALAVAAVFDQLALMTLLLQLGANVDKRSFNGSTTIGFIFTSEMLANGDVTERANLLLSWGAIFFPDRGNRIECSKEYCIHVARKHGEHELADLIKSDLGGRRCEIDNLTPRPELNGKTCVANQYLPESNQYKVTLENKSKEVLVLSPENLKRRDRTPEDCGYYIEFKNGRTIRRDFDSSEECQAFVAALNKGETRPFVTEEAEAAAEQAAAELLAELGLDDSSSITPNHNGGQVKKSKKKKGGRRRRNKYLDTNE